MERTPRQGDVVADRYVLSGFAGGGGMANVWKGYARGMAGFRRPVALKHIRPEFAADPKFVRMFVEEARVGSHLSHPNIVQVLDFVASDGGNLYLVMEWVEGLDLERYLYEFERRGHHAPWQVVVAIFVDALRGLAVAHRGIARDGLQVPILHRDISPQNILISVDGISKLMDFGCARALDRSKMTAPGIIKGKLQYISPEVARGTPSSVASEVFSCGLALWRALTGKLPYDHEDRIELFRLVRAARLAPVSVFRDDVPPALQECLDRALDRDPEKRFADALELKRALFCALIAEPKLVDEAVVAHSVARALRWRRERKVEPSNQSNDTVREVP